MTEPDIIATIGRCHRLADQDGQHRYRSWAHCYTHFQRHVRAKARPDRPEAALQLAFYLASWGMYRGSSFLLQKDYTVHRKAVDALRSRRWAALWATDKHVLERDASLPGEVDRLVQQVRASYEMAYFDSSGDPATVSENGATDTLVTKILLGTAGCCPAYDALFKEGERGLVRPVGFGVKSYGAVMGFVADRRQAFLDAQRRFRMGRTQYPLMKLADMYFWQIGWERDLEEKNSKKKAGGG
ncbi:hypothetical protein ACFLSJ_01125 [Verrucomicrobiota bacterium]